MKEMSALDVHVSRNHQRVEIFPGFEIGNNDVTLEFGSFRVIEEIVVIMPKAKPHVPHIAKIALRFIHQDEAKTDTLICLGVS